jgi:orotidine-5'-phosphate decarboxylase
VSLFIERLDAAARRNQSLLCVGLDPWLPSMPMFDIPAFNRAIIDATHDLVCAFKPNYAFYEAEGLSGLLALEATIKAIKDKGGLVILDAKRGDIGSTATAYAKAAFEAWDADAVTVNPYMGGDTLEPFLAYEDRGTLVLTRTSNPGGKDFEELNVGTEGRPLYEVVTKRAQEWNTASNIGLVVGATAPSELKRVRELAPDMPILIPGIGAQGGDLEASVRSGVNAEGLRVMISASRGIIYASKDADYAEAARKAAAAIREGINAELGRLGHQWQ